MKSKSRTKTTKKLPKKKSTRRLKEPKKKSTRRLGLKECKKRLSNKIRINMKEFKRGRYVSRKQAIAVSYSQIKKKYPECKKYF